MSETIETPSVSSLVWEGDRAPFAKAFIVAQKAMESVTKASSNPAFKTRYADLSAVVEAVIPALNAAGIGVLQFPAFDGENVSITTTFLHEGGSSVMSTLSLRPSKIDPQGVGSAITYGRRYSLLSMTGAAPEDDDGNASSGPRQERQRDDTPRLSLAVTAAQTAITMANDRKTLAAWKTANDAMIGELPTAYADAIVRSFNERWNAFAPAKGADEKSAIRVPPKANGFDLTSDEIPY